MPAPQDLVTCSHRLCNTLILVREAIPASKIPNRKRGYFCRFHAELMGWQPRTAKEEHEKLIYDHDGSKLLAYAKANEKRLRLVDSEDARRRLFEQ